MAGMAGMSTLPGVVSMPAKSSFIAAFEYDASQLTLTVHMLNGSIYQQKFVTPLDWAALQTSQNHSKHWANNIKGKKLSVHIKSAKAPRSEIRRIRGKL